METHGVSGALCFLLELSTIIFTQHSRFFNLELLERLHRLEGVFG
jgi:hypothetical protein